MAFCSNDSVASLLAPEVDAHASSCSPGTTVIDPTGSKVVCEGYVEEILDEYAKHADVANFPDWYTQLCYPCLPEPGMPQHPEPMKQPFFYIDAFYHRKFVMLANVQVKPLTGPLIYTGSNLGGWVPLFRAQFPAVESIIGVDMTPWYNDIARARYPDAEWRQLDLLALHTAFPPAHTDVVIDEVVVDHFTMHLEYFGPAIEQFQRVLQPDGLLVLSGRIKPKNGWVMETVQQKVEPHGFRLVAFQDLTEESAIATELMIHHVWGTADGCTAAISEQEQKQHPDPTADLKWELDRNIVRCKDRYKPLVIFVFRKTHPDTATQK